MLFTVCARQPVQMGRLTLSPQLFVAPERGAGERTDDPAESRDRRPAPGDLDASGGALDPPQRRFRDAFGGDLLAERGRERAGGRPVRTELGPESPTELSTAPFDTAQGALSMPLM
jgi:hypothetical protein